MRYDEHPTWRMLEKAKKQLADIHGKIPRFNHKRELIADAHRSIVRLQQAVEERICRDMASE